MRFTRELICVCRESVSDRKLSRSLKFQPVMSHENPRLRVLICLLWLHVYDDINTNKQKRYRIGKWYTTVVTYIFFVKVKKKRSANYSFSLITLRFFEITLFTDGFFVLTLFRMLWHNFLFWYLSVCWFKIALANWILCIIEFSLLYLDFMGLDGSVFVHSFSEPNILHLVSSYISRFRHHASLVFIRQRTLTVL